MNGDSSTSSTLDFSRYVDSTPVTAHPRLPLETVMELFRKIGPRVILIEYHGQLTGLVTVKDCLRYQFKVEAAENPKDDHRINEGQEQLWNLLRRAGNWVSGKVSRYSGGRIRLSSLDEDRPLARGGGQILDGDEEVGDEGVELESRR
jgi:chloride channel 3/4/5